MSQYRDRARTLDHQLAWWLDRLGVPENDANGQPMGFLERTKSYLIVVEGMKPSEVDAMLPKHAFDRLERAFRDKASPELSDSPTTPSSTVDTLVTLGQVAPLTGKSKRTLRRYYDKGCDLPEPDVPGGGGQAHRWYWSNLRPSLEQVCNVELPATFPASQIIPE